MKHCKARSLLLSLLLAVGPGSLAHAAHLVTFTRGQSIVVQSYEKRGSWYYFVLDGGGEVGVPIARVTRIEDYEAPPETAPAPGVAAVLTPPATPAGAPGAAGANEAPASGSAPQANAANPAASPGANVLSHGNDWRFGAKMSGGPTLQPLGGGIRKPPGMGGGMGAQGRGAGMIGSTGQFNRPQPPPANQPNQ
jgi:hypothetical protein